MNASDTESSIEMESTPALGHSPKQDNKWWCQINRRYLPLKFLYYFFIAGEASTLVFQSVFMKHLGLSTKQTGMLWAVHRSVGVVATPLSGAIADKTGKPKTVLCTLLACSAVIAMSMAFVPIEHHTSWRGNNTINIVCKTTNSFQKTPTPTFNETREAVVLSFHQIKKQCNDTNISVESETRANQSGLKDDVWEFVVNSSVCDCEMLKSMTMDFNLSCSGECKDKSAEISGDDYGVTFWAMFSLFLLASMCYPGCTPAIDASSFAILGEKNNHRFGQQRLFGSIGFGTAAFLIGTLKNSISSNMADPSSSNLPFYPAFFGALFFWLTSAAVASKLAISNSKSQPIALSNIKVILKNGQIVSFLLLVALFFGYAHAVTFSYEYWLLEEKLQASSLILGITSLCGSLSDIPCYIVSGYLTRRFGHKPVLIFGMMTFTLRLYLFTVITEAWQIIPVDILYGITWGLNWSAICSYASMISPPSLEYTTMAVVQTTTHGFGWSLGALLGGHIFVVMGSDGMFRLTALMVACATILYAVIGIWYHVKITIHKDKPKVNHCKKQEIKEESKNGDINGNDICIDTLLNPNSAI